VYRSKLSSAFGFHSSIPRTPVKDFRRMLERIFDTETFLYAQGALDGLAARHAAISDNIANVNTPGYRRKVVPFEKALAQSVQSHISECAGAACQPAPPFVPAVVRETRGSARADGNNVDIELEMAQMVDNTLRYETLTQYVSGFFSGLKTVINGGK
jgi:flagellar basal-body rod protein FlgB